MAGGWPFVLGFIFLSIITINASSVTSDSPKSFQLQLPPRPVCQNRKIGVVFLVENFFFSALWNAHDISHFISSHPDRYPDLQSQAFLDLKSFKSLKRDQLWPSSSLSSSSTPSTIELCIFLKSTRPEAWAVNKCKKLGAKIATLLDDIIPSMHMSLEEAKDFPWITRFDYVITVNSYTRAKIQEYIERQGITRPPKIWVLPVHHTNYHQARHPDPSAPVKVIGWQGTEENALSPELVMRLKDYCRRRGIEFREEFFPFPMTFPASQRTIEGYQSVIKNEFAKIASGFDIFVLFPPPFSHRFSNLLFKSASRFLFALSMGVPTVAYPFYSYLEAMSQSHQDYPAIASSEDDLIRWLDYLIDNSEARVELSRRGLRLAERFEVGRVMDMWADHLRGEFCGVKEGEEKGEKEMKKEEPPTSEWRRTTKEEL